MMKLLTSIFLLTTVLFSQAQQKKNVLFLMADDFNYWAKCIGYYDQVKTPNIDKLASQGVLFTDALCSSPVCNPSRNALWSGYRPSTTGISSNGDGYVRDKSKFSSIITLNQYFTDNGYWTYGVGKLYHPGRMGGKETDPSHWSKLNTSGSGCNGGSLYKFGLNSKSNYKWSANNASLSEGNCNDYSMANDVADLISGYAAEDHGGRPFFIGCGFFRPHMPWNSPKEFWEKFEEDDMTIPPGYNDQDAPGNDIHQEIVNNDKWRQGIQAYLASMALADSNVGFVLNALENSSHKDNTVIVFTGDHGWHLGEKGRWGKFATWNEANQTTMIIYDPSKAGNGQKCHKVVSLQDLYPTLVEICGLPEKESLEGRSLAPLLDNPSDEEWDWPILMTYRGTDYIKTNKWYYINEGNSSKLFNNIEDQYHWNNLYGKPGYNDVIEKLVAQIDSMKQIGYDFRDKLSGGGDDDDDLNEDIDNHSIPGKIEAEDFNTGGEGFGFHDTDTDNKGNVYRYNEGVDIEETIDYFGGYNVGWIKDGEWLKYSITDVNSGEYRLGLRLAASKDAGQKVKVYIDDELFETVDVPHTGGYQNWETVWIEDVEIDEPFELKIEAETNDFFNINFINFDLVNSIFNNVYLSGKKKILKSNLVHDVLELNLTYTNVMATVQIYDTYGRQLVSQNVIGEQKVVFDLPDQLKTGAYYLVLNDGEIEVTERFVKK